MNTGNLWPPGLVLRSISSADQWLVFEWRNRPEIVALSASRRVVARDEHSDWFSRLNDANRHFVRIIEVEGEPAGMVRLERHESKATISVFLVSPFTGRRLGVPVIEKACKMAACAWPDLQTIEARIRHDNRPSLRVFERAGFETIGEEDGFCILVWRMSGSDELNGGLSMTTRKKTAQEEFWAGDFGEGYIERNRDEQFVASNIQFFSRALRHAGKITSCVELGANIGLNLKALRLLYPDLDATGVEINKAAVAELSKVVGPGNAIHSSIFDWAPTKNVDLALIKGVLIHINPDMLPIVYDRLYAASSRYLLIGEYYSPVPVAIPNRGHEDRLFKRDFAGEILDRFTDLRLIDYGFAYHRDPACPQDDITWFLIEKRP